ncbi:MAG: hypothetical protein H0X62_04035, partial [Bacteroidetes bacterium]|nr:hypothetical protein [Bacteroidota bacterium]
VLVATPTGINLIGTIKNELLKSAELTGQWEFKLRQIEKGEYDFRVFVNEMKQMVSSLVSQVVQEKSNAMQSDSNLKCPKCKTAELVKGKTAVGCKNFSACGFKVTFMVSGIELNDEQLMAFVKTGNLKVKKDNIEGSIAFNNNYEAFFKEDAPKAVKAKVEKQVKKQVPLSDIICPKCKGKGFIKGSTAFGCSNWKTGCDYRLPLDSQIV